MDKSKHIFKKIYKISAVSSLALILLATAVCAIAPISEDREIYGKVIRLHVIANSDSEQDQALKLKVRDAILSDVASCTEGCLSKEEAEEKIAASIDIIRQTAENTLRENGSDYPVTVTLGEEAFPTREYGDVKLPSGSYTSLKVNIGTADGKNWWCVLFPPLCTSSAEAKDELVSAGFTPGQVRILTDSESPRYVLRFRILEFISSLF